jgi:hypothetical protein
MESVACDDSLREKQVQEIARTVNARRTYAIGMPTYWKSDPIIIMRRGNVDTVEVPVGWGTRAAERSRVWDTEKSEQPRNKKEKGQASTYSPGNGKCRDGNSQLTPKKTTRSPNLEKSSAVASPPVNFGRNAH